MTNVLIKARIQTFLKNNLGKSGRGFTTLEIKKAIDTNLTTRQLGRILAELVNLGILIFTGHTKGKRFVLSEFKKIAEFNSDIDCRLNSMPYSYKWFKKMCLTLAFEISIFEEYEEVKKFKRISLKRFCQSLPQFRKQVVTYVQRPREI
jgi:hypothetical protein